MIVSVLDACVLYPPSLRDLFMWLAAAIVYQPRWTEDIPDKYRTALLDDAPELFLMGVKDHRASLKRPPKTVDDYIETLKINGLKRLAARLEQHREVI